jgi:hypothetical protein
VRRLDHVFLEVGVESVLRPEDGAEVDAASDGAVHDVTELAVDGRGIAHESDGSPGEQLAIEQNV